MRFKKLKWEEMTIEEKVSNLKNRIWKFFQKYPHIKEIIGAPNIVGGTGDRVKTDDGFKEVLSKIGDAHPGSNVHAKHGSKDIKREKSVATIKKHAAIQSRKNDTTKN